MPEFLPLIVRLLAVIGGAVLGWLAITFLVGMIRRFLGVTSVPRPPYLIARALGAVAAGWVIWLWVFGSGGGGIGGPGGPGIGGAPGTGKTTSPDQPRPTQLAAPNHTNTLTIVMLGGNRVKEERFYEILGETEARTLSDLKEVLKKRRSSGLQGIKIAIYDDSVAKNHPAVTSLEDWARQNDLQVSEALLEGKAP